MIHRTDATFGRGPVQRGPLTAQPETVGLDSMRPGDTFVVAEVPEGEARVTALRFGMAEGTCAQCATRIPAGPIVLRAGRQEIAVGRSLARRIRVRHTGRAN